MPTNNLVVVSDIHASCKLALCPPEGVSLTDGGIYMPSDFQRKLWTMWRDFWENWVPMICRGEPFDVVINGELVDGVHHRSTTQFTQNKQNQKEVAVAILEPIAQMATNFYVVSGTAVHSGESGCDDEGVAKELGAVPDETGRFARYVLWKQVGGALINIMHHIGVTGSQHYESTAPMKELVEAFAEAGRWNNEPPDFVIRSHRHRYCEIRVPTHKGFAAVAVTPGWQGKTPYAYRMPGARQAPPQFGGIIIRQGDEEAYLRQKVWTIKRPAVEE